eukprot:gnl/TRDRNA2_/TRDRNA2_86262_c0_seq6.p1 gnl/TRDRNA2_/TRDRNA2_86262_c0~~gnl/TRDRNA2_/TRDRNA2_86262_c0_seq6.p1  ORF type:complete len:228 (-),score=24.04 gnl/TRDRNA2_/TRDRNA2_86262_c0_seq6:237-920(-)
MALQFAGARAAARARHHASARMDTHNKFRDAATAARIEANTPRIDPNEPPEQYLARIGYVPGSVASDDAPGRAASHVLTISVEGHEEVNSCTLYIMKCKFGGAADEMWFCKKRLCDLREELHDHVKEILGEAYPEHFGETPFARFGGLPGTTDRLRGWMESLARCMNAGMLNTSSCAFVLRFLSTPIPRHGTVPVNAWEQCKNNLYRRACTTRRPGSAKQMVRCCLR